MNKKRLADLITFSRIAFLPFLIMSELQGKYFQSLAIMLLISVSDIIDGIVARKGGNSSKNGQILDIAADFIVVFSIFLFWYLEQTISIYILFLILFSFSTFIYASILKRKIMKNKIGQYTGAICFAGIILIFFSRLYFKEICVNLQNIAFIIISIHLIISIIENIWSLIKKGYSI